MLTRWPKLTEAVRTSSTWLRRVITVALDGLVLIATLMERLLRGMDKHTPRDLRDCDPAHMKPLLEKQAPLLLVAGLAVLAAIAIATL